MADFDSRVTPARPDVADWSLRDRVQARRYIHPTPYQVIEDGAPLKFTASGRARQESQLLYGEVFNVYERQGDWFWGQNVDDSYVGFVRRNHLTKEVVENTHMVHSLRTFCYPEPDMKLPVDRTISFGSKVSVTGEQDSYSRIRGGDWIYSKHLLPLDTLFPDYLSTALTFLGTPYLWGGRSSKGLDCSALVQLCLMRSGIDVPRDADLLEQAVGYEVDQSKDLSAIKEGDLIFFPGHVGFVFDEWRFLHANAFDMQVSIHSLSEVLDRAQKNDEPYSSVRRISETRDL